MNAVTSDLVIEQLAYYRARAGEYDDWWFRRGRYDRGPELNARWFSEVEYVRQALREFDGYGKVVHALDLAAGTGLWTTELLTLANRVTGLDAAPEALAVNRERNIAHAVRLDLDVVDLFAWEPDAAFDLVFTGFWLSHVPPDRLDAFLYRMAQATRRGGRLFIVDSRFTPASTASNHVLNHADAHWQSRRLDDGREFRVVKVFLDPHELARRIGRLGFTAEGHVSGEFFLYVTAIRT